MDELDWAILDELQADARLSYNELARRVHLSAPSVAERVRRLERDGVITGYQAMVDPGAVGLGVTAFVRMGCDNKRCVRRQLDPAEFPEVLALHRISGDDCSVLRVAARDVAHLEELLDRLARWSRPSTSIVLATYLDHTPISRAALGGRQPESG
jgi:Lrp/AsnC family transcriptional regulator, leucine-responsive regulatory protein